MSKKYNIRWRKKDRKKISNTVRKFNAKITRTLKKNPDWEQYIPDRINVKDVTKMIETRQDFNRILNSYERFMKKGAEMPFTSQKGIQTTMWEKREVGIKVAQINRARTMETKKANVSTYKGTMGTIESNNLKPKTYDINKIKPREWGHYIKTVNKQVKSKYKDSKIEKYKQNYLRTIRENLGYGQKANELYDFVLGLDATLMYDVYYDDPILEIQFISDPLPADTIAEKALEHWKSL